MDTPKERFRGGRAEQPSDARISAQIAFMGDQLGKTRAMVSELEECIDPILIPNMPDGLDPVDSPERKLASELSNAIDDLNASLLSLQSKIGRITERVQL